MKRTHAIVIAALMVLVLTAGAHAVQTITLGTVCKDGHLLVPARVLFQQLGASVAWTESTRTMTATTDETRLAMQVDYSRALVNGREYELKAAPTISDGRVMVPVRFSAETMGYEVRYRQGKVELLQDGNRVFRIISASGPPRCILKGNFLQQKGQNEQKPAPEKQKTGQTEKSSVSKAEQKPINCDVSGFRKVVLEADKPVLVEFWAPWCGPCLMMGPTLDAIARRYAGEAKIVKVDISRSCNQPLVLEYGIHSIPYMAVFRDGQVVEHLVGVRPPQDIAAALDRASQK